jgi:hypothetical protein
VDIVTLDDKVTQKEEGKLEGEKEKLVPEC